MRTAEEEARQIRVAAEFEAEKARKAEERYAEFRSDISRIIKDHYLLFFGQPKQKQYYYGYKEDSLCWGAELYQFIVNEEGNAYESANVLPSNFFPEG